MSQLFATKRSTDTSGWESLGDHVDYEALEGIPDFHVLPVAEDTAGIYGAGFARAEASKHRLVLQFTETLCLLEGRATAELQDGSVVELSPGDAVHLAKGQTITWTYHERVKFHYVLQQN